MRFIKKKLMEKPISALMALCLIEGIDTIGIERTRDDLSNLILLMAGQTYPEGGVRPGDTPLFTAPDQDSGVSARVRRIREQAESA